MLFYFRMEKSVGSQCFQSLVKQVISYTENRLKIWKVEAPDDFGGYDTFDSFVCVAYTEEGARNMHPVQGELSENETFWNVYRYDWIKKEDIHQLKVTFIGHAADNAVPGVICASYNAG
jgi:hypothetical protein